MKPNTALTGIDLGAGNAAEKLFSESLAIFSVPQSIVNEFGQHEDNEQ
jgi:hypothetical protein